MTYSEDWMPPTTLHHRGRVRLWLRTNPADGLSGMMLPAEAVP